MEFNEKYYEALENLQLQWYNCLDDSDKYYRALENLEEQWDNCLDELFESNFDFDKFKLVAKETFHWLEKFSYAGHLPLGIVSLLLHVNNFSHGPVLSKESDAARRVAETFCDVMNYSGISDDYYEGDNYEISPNGERHLEVSGATGFHAINTDTFDLTELMNDLPYHR